MTGAGSQPISPSSSLVGTDFYGKSSPKAKPITLPSEEKVLLPYQSPSAPILLAQVTPARPVEKAPAANDVLAAKHYLVMLGEIRSLGYLRGWRNIQYAINFDDYGKVPKGEQVGGWPADKTVKDVMNEDVVSKLNLPSYVRDNMLSEYDTIKSNPSAKTEFRKFVMVYDHFASNIFIPYDDTVSTYDLFGRLAALNATLPAGSRLSNTGGLSAKAFDPPKVLEDMQALNRKRSSFSPDQKEAFDEMVVICTLATVKYMRGLRAVQNGNDIDEYGKDWPSDRTFKDLLDSSNDVDSEVKQNITGVYNNITAKKEFGRYVKTYDYYANAFAGFSDMIGFDPLDKIKGINDRVLCGAAKLDSVNEKNFNEISFLNEVNRKVTPEAVAACYAPVVFNREVDMPWEVLKPIWIDYIVRVYAAMRVDLGIVKGADDKSGIQMLDILLERGHKDISGNSAGITANDVESLTRSVMIASTGKEIPHNYYMDKALTIHTDVKYVPDTIKSQSLGIVPVFYKMGVAGIKIKGIRVPQGIGVPGQQ